MKGEVYSYLLDELFNIGCLDVFITPIIMKKGRPGNILTVLCEDTIKEKVIEKIFRETTTFGIRSYEVERNILERKMVKRMTKYGKVNVKEGYYKGKLIKTSLEYEDGKKIALEKNIPLIDVYKEI